MQIHPKRCKQSWAFAPFFTPALVLAVVLSWMPAAAALARGGPVDFPISIDLKEADAQVVLSSFHDITGLVGTVDPGIDGKVTIKVEKVSWSAALDALCEPLGCAWRLESGHPRTLDIVLAHEGKGESSMEQPISIDLVLADGMETLRTLARILETELVVEDGEAWEGTVTMTVQEARVSTLLDMVCEQLGCRWSLEESRLVLERRDLARGSAKTAGEAAAALAESISLQLKEAPAAQTLRAFGAVLGVPVRIDPLLGDGSVTIDLQEATAHDALNQTCALLGCSWRLVPDGEGMVLEIQPTD